MKNNNIKNKNDSFNHYFESIYGSRWPELKAALSENRPKVIRQCFIEKLSELNPFELPKASEINKAASDPNHSFYIMDAASIIAALAVGPTPGPDVLDMCSAPGGKGLVLFELMEAEAAIKTDQPSSMVFNELSRTRRERLKKVIRQYIPEKKRGLLTVHGRDGLSYGQSLPASFDTILLDAPCSGEQHLIQNPVELDKWSIKRTKRLAAKQYGLLCSALLSLKPRGVLVYSTCSISPEENDLVIKKLLHKKGDQFQIDPLFSPMYAEKTEFGHHYLPDKSGYGPLYICRILKN